MSLTYPLEYSCWYDLVFHVLANLPVDPRDAGRLYDSKYIHWVNQRFSPTAPEQRTLLSDAPLITGLYNKTEKAFHLNRFPLLFNNFDDFNGTIESTFDQISWKDPKKKQMADFLIEYIPVELLELFRIALWSEAKAGYQELHLEHIVPLYKKQIPVLENEFSTIVNEVKGLADSRFKVSHPLRRFGRLLWPGKEPLIFIGLPDNELDVPAWAPVMQGCHEYVLSKVINLPGAFMGTERLHSTRRDTEGYFYHMAPEIMALSIEAWLFKEKYRDRFCNWVKGCLPPTCKALAAALPWKVENIPQGEDIDTLVDWLASIEMVPDSLKEFYLSIRDWFSAS
ncbi:MAG: hypothetical protein GTN68_21410 [Candidatus Aminicenantes bacterium]|nr:hypothetical protein [Candidatus Aminicenantes bacterium]NIO83112.1 hypothetical protein [Candidatus Aminicenantes bacterium]